MHIRNAVAADVPSLLPLVAAYWDFERILGFEAKPVACQLERLLNEQMLGAGWIALSGDLPIGYLLTVFVFSLEHLGLTAEIDEFFVSPARRGSGVGTELLTAAEAECAQIGCTCMSLRLSRGNEAACNFYYRHGYGKRPEYELLDTMLTVV